ncbi:MAG TPA: hypothetical protein VF173_15480 [Thermoanaerobaculia bacterium]|nr:hypothetical protein [Thermoanaerobaculia bacterium]
MGDRPPSCLNAFSPEYLSALRERDDPSSALEAELAGPWTVREHDESFHLFREWESFETGHRPFASFAGKEDAVIFLTALRMLARPPLFRGRETDSPPAGFLVEREGEVSGAFRTYQRDLVLSANVLAGLARSSADLANVLGIAGGTAQEIVGEILGAAVLSSTPEPAEP